MNTIWFLPVAVRIETFSFNMRKYVSFSSISPEGLPGKIPNTSWYLSTSGFYKSFSIHQYFTRHSGVYDFLSLLPAYSENFSRLWLNSQSNSKYLISSVPCHLTCYLQLSDLSLSPPHTVFSLVCACLVFIFLFPSYQSASDLISHFLTFFLKVTYCISCMNKYMYE